MSNEIIRRRALRSSGAAIDWESIARGMLDNIRSFELPEGADVNTSSASQLFYRQHMSGHATIKDGVANVANASFHYCYALEGATIPSSVTSIGQNAFAHCRAMTELVVLATTPPTLGNNALNGTTALASIYVPDASVEAYKAATNWSTYASIIKPISERPVGGVILNQFSGWLAAAERVAA